MITKKVLGGTFEKLWTEKFQCGIFSLRETSVANRFERVRLRKNGKPANYLMKNQLVNGTSGRFMENGNRNRSKTANG